MVQRLQRPFETHRPRFGVRCERRHGRSGGAAHLIHSNLDWGQDLLLLKRWQAEHPEAKPLHLAYFASYDPKDVGIEYVQPDMTRIGEQRATIPEGWYAVSVNFLRGFPYFTYRLGNPEEDVDQQALTRFQQLKPVDRIGYSIYIYHVTLEDANRVREELNLDLHTDDSTSDHDT